MKVGTVVHQGEICLKVQELPGRTLPRLKFWRLGEKLTVGRDETFGRRSGEPLLK